MHTNGTVVLTPACNILVVHHPGGFTVLELAEAGLKIGIGDKVRADWEWSGRGEVSTNGDHHRCHFHRSCRRQGDAELVAAHFYPGPHLN